MGRQRSQQSGPTACRAEHVRWEQRTSTEARNQESQLHSEFHPENRTQHYTRAEPLSRASHLVRYRPRSEPNVISFGSFGTVLGTLEVSVVGDRLDPWW